MTQILPIVSFHKHDKIVWAVTTARLRLAILNAHTDVPLIFYLLHKIHTNKKKNYFPHNTVTLSSIYAIFCNLQAPLSLIKSGLIQYLIWVWWSSSVNNRLNYALTLDNKFFLSDHSNLTNKIKKIPAVVAIVSLVLAI